MMYSTIDEKGMLLNIHESHFWWYFQVLLMIAKNMWESPNAILKKHKTSPGTYDRLVISSPNARSLCHWKHSHEADPRAPKDRPPGWWWKSPSPVATRHSLQHTRDDLPSTEGSKDIQIGIQLILECVGNIVGISWNPMKTCPLKNGIPTYSKHIGHLKALGFSGSREDEPLPRWGHPKSPARIAGVSYLFRRMERWLIEWERVINNTHTRMKRCQKALSYSQTALETGEPSIPTWNPTRSDLFSRNNSCFKQRVASVTDGSAAQPATQTGNLCS